MTDLFVPGTPIAAKDSVSPESTWQTPQWLVERIRKEVFPGYISLDPCTNENNPTCAGQFYTPETDGLALPWDSGLWIPGGMTIFVNPPFINASEWAAKCLRESRLPYGPRIVFLGPAAIGTKWLHDLWESCDDALFLNKRLRFECVCTFKIGEKPNRRACCLGPESSVHDKTHPEYHRYTTGSPTRGTALFALNCNLSALADLGTIARAA